MMNCGCAAGLSKTLMGPSTQSSNSKKKKRPSVHDELGQEKRRPGIFMLPNNKGHNPQEFYDVDKTPVGTGAFGTVKLARNKKTKQEFAMKTMKKAMIKDISAFVNEVRINMMMDHPNIVKLFETFEDDQNMYLLLELCTGGEMFDLIIQEENFCEAEAATLMNQIMRAVLYMHTQAVAHRDLKPENFLLKDKGVPIDSNTLKIIDFGIAKQFKKGEGEGAYTLKTKAGTAYYIAPEVYRGSGYNEKCDIWSAGVILYILLSGMPPFSGDDKQMRAATLKGNIDFGFPEFDAVSDEAKKLIRQMCTLDPRKRPGAKEVLDSGWMRVQRTREKSGQSPMTSTNLVQKLRAFSSASRFKKAALNIIVHRINDDQITRLRSTFLRLDRNGDGLLTLEELKHGLLEAGITDMEEIGTLFRTLDIDNSGEIGYSEFLAAMIDQKNYLEEELCWQAFRVFDSDGNGRITLDEFRTMLSAEHSEIPKEITDEKEVQALFNLADTDGNGMIDFQEFMAAMRR